MLGRQVGTSLLRLPRVAHLPIRSLPQYELAVRTLAPFAHRSYASITPSRPGRPKKAVGEPSRPVKRAVKRAAKSPKEDAATAKVKARKETAAKKKKATAKPTSKAKAPARPKKKVAKKVVSEEQKTKLAAKLVKRKEEKAVKVRQARITELKKIALDPPAVKNLNTWIVFSSERLTGQNMTGLKQDGINAAFAEQQKRSVEAYKNITPAEKEHYNHLAHTRKEKSQADYKQFVESHTVEEIEAANKARVSLRRMLKEKPGTARQWPAIKDERLVKKPMTPYLQFSVNRRASGDFKSIKLADAQKLIAQEWHALTEGEKEKYKALHIADAVRYNDEYSTVHGHAPAHPLGGEQAQAAAAA